MASRTLIHQASKNMFATSIRAAVKFRAARTNVAVRNPEPPSRLRAADTSCTLSCGHVLSSKLDMDMFVAIVALMTIPSKHPSLAAAECEKNDRTPSPATAVIDHRSRTKESHERTKIPLPSKRKQRRPENN